MLVTKNGYLWLLPQLIMSIENNKMEGNNFEIKFVTQPAVSNN